MTYSDLLLCFVFVLLVYPVLEVKELCNLIAYYMEPPQQSARFGSRPRVGMVMGAELKLMSLKFGFLRNNSPRSPYRPDGRTSHCRIAG
jgi:hypothetical protein